MPQIHTIFNTRFQHIESLAEETLDEGFIINKDPLEERKSMIARKIFDTKTVAPLELIGAHRPVIKDNEVINSTYDETGAQLKRAQESEKDFRRNKAPVRCYGYKHLKSMKFYATLLLCLRDCYESKYEQLNIDMNYMLLLKNELSLAFLRGTHNITNTLKSAIKIYCDERAGRGELWQTEMALLEKLFD